VVGTWHLHLYGTPGKSKIEALGDGFAVPTAIDDLHIVDTDDRKTVVETVESSPRFEIANDELRLEAVLCHLPVNLDVLSNAFWGINEISIQAFAPSQLIAEVAQSETVDFFDGDTLIGSQLVGQKGVGAPRHDDTNFVASVEQVTEDDGAPSRMSHPFSNDAVEDSHLVHLIAIALELDNGRSLSYKDDNPGEGYVNSDPWYSPLVPFSLLLT
jgi:hypothetical protein